MLKNRSVCLVYALAVVIALIFIGRNLYRRYVNNALAAAVKARDAAAVRSLLERGADPNMRVADPRYDSQHALLVPILSVALDEITRDPGAGRMQVGGHNADAEEIAGLLIGKGARPQQGGRYLERACWAGSVATARLLLDHGVDPNAPDNVGALMATLNYSAPLQLARTPEEKERWAKSLVTTRQLVRLLQEHGVHLTLMQAQTIGDTATVKKILDGTLPGVTRDGYFAMTQAAYDGDLQTIRQLLKRGIDPNRPPQVLWLPPTAPGAFPHTDSPLHAAVSQGRMDAVKLLLAHGADPNGVNQYFPEAPLTAAVRSGNHELIALLLAHGASPNPVSSQGSGPLPLPAAANSGNLELVQWLLRHGAKLNSDGYSPALRAAVWGRHPDVVHYLLEHGASTATQSDAASDAANTILTLALQYLPKVVPDLLKHGAPVNLPPRRTPPPDTSVHLPTMQRLSPNKTTPDSPLIAAVWYAPRYESTLVKAGAKIGPDRTSICAAAALQKRLDLLPKLLAYGADINGADAEHDTALTICVESAPEMVPTLLEHGANPGVLSENRETPLQIAARRGNIALVRLLLAHGADVNAHAGRSHSALYWARKKHHDDLVALLLQAGGRE